MIRIKTSAEIELMRQGGKILGSVLAALEKEAKPGVTTAHLNELAEELILKAGGWPAFKGFQGYPAALCASVNEEIVHALPSERKLKEGDIVGLDLGVLFPAENCSACPFSSKECGSQPGLNTDAAITVKVGRVSEEAERLVRTAKEALQAAIDLVRPGRKISEISSAIQKRAEKEGFSAIRELIGHGVGYELHEDPDIPNYFDDRFKDVILKEGMTLAIEPMISSGSYKIKKGKDGFVYETADKSLASHFEHTVAVTKDGCEILTIF